MAFDQELSAAFRGQNQPPRRQSPVFKGYLPFALIGFLLCATFVDYLLFSITRSMTRESSDMTAYVDHRLSWLPSISFTKDPYADRDFAAQPITNKERTKFNRDITPALPAELSGWSQRGFERADFWALRPDMKPCEKHDEAVLKQAEMLGSLRNCPAGFDGNFTRVLTKDDKRVVLQMAYAPTGERIDNLSAVVKANFSSGSERKKARPYTRTNGVSFAIYPRIYERRGQDPIKMPKRAYGSVTGEGTLHIFAISDASDVDFKRVLSSLDYDLLRAIVAPAAP